MSSARIRISEATPENPNIAPSPQALPGIWRCQTADTIPVRIGAVAMIRPPWLAVVSAWPQLNSTGKPMNTVTAVTSSPPQAALCGMARRRPMRISATKGRQNTTRNIPTASASKSSAANLVTSGTAPQMEMQNVAAAAAPQCQPVPSGDDES